MKAAHREVAFVRGWLLVLVIALPSALAAPTTLYVHAGPWEVLPMNTQAPPTEWAIEERAAHMSLSCASSVLPSGSLQQDHHTWYGFSSLGLVRYDPDIRAHFERGLADDVVLDAAFAPVLHWPLFASFDTAPTALTNVVVEATLRTGDDVSVGHEAFNDGELLAEGRAGPFTLAPVASDVPPDVVDGRHVYDIAVPMELRSRMIARDEGYNLRVDVFLDNPACSEPAMGYTMAGLMGLHSSAEHRPRLELGVLNPLEIMDLHPQRIGDDLVVHAAGLSPWGSYDIADAFLSPGDPAAPSLTIEGPGDATASRYTPENKADCHGCGGRPDPWRATWLWEGAASATPGVYTATLRMSNDQQTAELVRHVRFNIGPATDEELACGDLQPCVPRRIDAGATTESPGAGLLVLAAVLLAAIVRAKRPGA